MFPPPLLHYLAQHHLGTITASQPVGGGCINEGQVLTTSTGQRLFLKQNAHAPSDMFAREAEGLAMLRAQTGGPRAPEPLVVAPDFLLLEYLPAGPLAPDYWPTFGQRLAALHAHTQPQFGFAHANYIGSTPQPNPWEADGFKFFTEQRLLFQGQLARERGLLTTHHLRQLEHLAARLPALIPEQPASAVHGDLWSGNIIPGPAGHACLIDPAAHYGWAEADLAMTMLFGTLPAAFYAAYTAARPLPTGWQQRMEIYNLYHLLNHLNLFGGGYLGGVLEVLRKYGK